MKINDVLNEDTYGFDDVKTAASSFLKNLMKGAGIEDAKQYAMRDRAVRMIAKGFQNQWKNIVYDLRRMYEPSLKKDPSKGKQNLSTIESRVVNFIANEIGASTNSKEVLDAKNTIISASVDPKTGAYQNPGKLNGADVADAFTRIAANAVTNIAYQQQQAQTGNNNVGLGQTGDSYKPKNKNDYGKKLDGPLDSLVNKFTDNPNWFKNATVPVLIVTQLHIREDGGIMPLRYIKLDGRWYQDGRHPDDLNVIIDDTTTAKEEDYGALGNVMLERHIANGSSTPGTQDFMQSSDIPPNLEGEFDLITWSGPWGIRRQGDIENRYIILSDDEYQKWATGTGRIVIQSAGPTTEYSEQYNKTAQLVKPKMHRYAAKLGAGDQ
jgi:hypothetical protein